MTEQTTTHASDAIELIVQSISRLEDPFEDNCLEISHHLVSVLHALTERFGPEYFSEVECSLISHASVIATQALIDAMDDAEHSENFDDTKEDSYE